MNEKFLRINIGISSIISLGLLIYGTILALSGNKGPAIFIQIIFPIILIFVIIDLILYYIYKKKQNN